MNLLPHSFWPTNSLYLTFDIFYVLVVLSLVKYAFLLRLQAIYISLFFWTWMQGERAGIWLCTQPFLILTNWRTPSVMFSTRQKECHEDARCLPADHLHAALYLLWCMFPLPSSHRRWWGTMCGWCVGIGSGIYGSNPSENGGRKFCCSGATSSSA